MAILGNIGNYNYLEEDTNVNTRISIFKYQRPRPGAQLLRQPVGFITLPLPTNMPADYYSMSLLEDNLGALGNATGLDPNKGESVAQLTNTIRERLGLSDTKAGAVAAAMAGILAGAPVISDALSSKINGILPISQTFGALTGVAKNPHTAVMFNNVNLRTFQFNWTLSPRSQRQSESLNTIITLLKRTMHPNLAVGGFALDYPNLFTLSLNNDKEGIANVDYSFLSDMQVNGTPNGHVYYRDGYPSVIQLSLMFKEVRIKTAEDFYNANADGTPNTSDSNPRGPR